SVNKIRSFIRKDCHFSGLGMLEKYKLEPVTCQMARYVDNRLNTCGTMVSVIVKRARLIIKIKTQSR
ncbi:MAG: hypothetical protein KKD21_04910, partial [Proteobacteria bacterium]|nr:hypothetical protein [Pseudomonadota bacterium]